MEQQMAWYNYDSCSYDYRSNGPQTDDEAVHYIPQGAARGLYSCYRTLGEPVGESMIKTLQAVCGVNNEATNA